MTSAEEGAPRSDTSGIWPTEMAAARPADSRCGPVPSSSSRGDTATDSVVLPCDRVPRGMATGTSTARAVHSSTSQERAST